MEASGNLFPKYREIQIAKFLGIAKNDFSDVLVTDLVMQ